MIVYEMSKIRSKITGVIAQVQYFYIGKGYVAVDVFWYGKYQCNGSVGLSDLDDFEVISHPKDEWL